MQIPLPLDEFDEVSAGHLGRALKWNRLDSAKRARAELVRSTRSCPVAATASSVAALAVACEMSLTDYVRRHSVIPFLHFAIPRLSSERKPTHWRSWAIDRYAFWTGRNGALLCRACVEADQRKLGYSLWRRTHQLPGQFECLWHRERLFIFGDARAFKSLPSHVLSVAIPVEPDKRPGYLAHSGIQGFALTCREMLRADHPFDLERVESAIQVHALHFGVRVSVVNPCRELVDEAHRRLPTDFVTTMTGPRGTLASRIALAISLFFDKPSDALTAFHRQWLVD